MTTKGRILEINHAACTMLGYPREELLEMQISDVDARETPDEIADHIQKSIEQVHDTFETQHRRKDGTIIDVQINFQYSNIKGGVFIAFVRDISEEKRSKQALRESDPTARDVFGGIGYILGLVGVAAYFNYRRKSAEIEGKKPD